MGQEVFVDLWLVRHGQAEHNSRNLIGGRRTDARLTERGKQQARALGTYLEKSGVRFTSVHSSSMNRANHTARLILEEMTAPTSDLAIDQHAELDELDHGVLEGRLRSEVYTPELRAQMDTHGMDFCFENGESQRCLQQRAYAALEGIIAQTTALGHRSSRIAIVCHKITIGVLIQRLTGCHEQLCWRQAIDNTSFSRFQLDKLGWRPITINATPHLPLVIE